MDDLLKSWSMHSAAMYTNIRLERPGTSYPPLRQEIAPMLAFSQSDRERVDTIQGATRTKPKLYLVPTPLDENEERESEFSRQPTSSQELPEVNEMVKRFVLGVVEVWGGRRSPMQLARASHRLVYQKLLQLSGAQNVVPRIRKFYINQPIDGVVEATATLKFDNRVRSLILRFEGVDKRWLCTEFHLL